MGRANLGALLGTLDDPPPPSKPDPEQATRPVDEPIKKPARKSAKSDRTAATAAPPVSSGAGYLRFVRKETRLREDQQNALTENARRLGRAKRAGAPRITDNTLIRVAVDLLLDHIDTATGDDEQALLDSLRQHRDAASSGSGS
ncbi:hypothetical protein NY547_13205 [Cnuibacter physcomitrellae]|uniref:hypothetical protein n=1 Tax=Cnuibacter physcomitrellae TaxID=1619308 RepID=UPI0021758545|nr:hypothetical protein [Cnuibacter physcomitrellae]MCS5498201.1 hypothetical protein [Cnuibacter physcomitrellae]